MLDKLTNNMLITHLDNREFTKFIIDNSPEVYWILDENNNTVFISDSIELMTGYTSSEFLELKPEQKYSKESEEYLKYLLNSIDKSIEIFQSNKFEKIKLEYKRKSGNLILTEVSGTVVIDKYNKFKGIYGITKNISDKVRLNSELIAEREKNIIAQNFTSSILGLVGHEFKTPLNGILGFTQILSKSSNSPDDSEMLNDIYQSAQRLNATLNSIVTLAAIETNQLKIFPTDLDLNEILSSIQNSFSTILESKNIHFEIINDCNIKSIFIDVNCFYQILYHLVDNAIKFTDDGKIAVSIINAKILHTDYVEVCVEDSGIGINEQKFNSIFEPFRQISEGNNRQYEGLGIGLSTTKKLVEKLNGTITVSSVIGRGSIFTVRIPINETNVKNILDS